MPMDDKETNLGFRIAGELNAALERAARAQMSSKARIVRVSLAEALRSQGYLRREEVREVAP
jgi:hypothetical protein